MRSKRKDSSMSSSGEPDGGTVNVLTVERGEAQVYIVGTSPLILHRMSQKAIEFILEPPGKKNEAERRANLKHEPLQEFRDSAYMLEGDDAPTLLAQLCSAFKGAMGTAALDQPGAKKSQIGRLVYVQGDLAPVYGEPKVFMSVVRDASINRTPDVRTRAIVPNWACTLKINYAMPLIKSQSVVNLLAAAGVTAGVGDWRPEKGKGSYGCFRLARVDDPEYLQLTHTWGRAAQIAAMRQPACYDTETEELLAWHHGERRRRGFGEAA